MVRYLSKWIAYIPESGHWAIRGHHANAREARKAFVAQMNHTFPGWGKRMPNGSHVMREDEDAKARK